MKTKLIILLSCLLLPTSLWASQSDDMPNRIPSIDGSFSGSLNYIDYRSQKPVAIPMTMRLLTSSDGTKLLVDTVFTDPGYQVFSFSVMRYSHKNNTWTVDSFENESHSTESYSITRFEVESDNEWSLTRSKVGTDDNREAKLTVFESVSGNQFRSETRVDYLDTPVDENLRRNWVELRLDPKG